MDAQTESMHAFAAYMQEQLVVLEF
jgi:hypothetical protein